MAGNESNDAMFPDPAVVLMTCSCCYRQWLTLEYSRKPLACFACRAGRLRVTATWTADACPWWPWLNNIDAPVEPPGLFLRWLARAVVEEHPAGPIGSHWATPGMQLRPPGHGADCTFEEPGGTCTFGCRTTWTYDRCAGSDN